MFSCLPSSSSSVKDFLYKLPGPDDLKPFPAITEKYLSKILNKLENNKIPCQDRLIIEHRSDNFDKMVRILRTCSQWQYLEQLEMSFRQSKNEFTLEKATRIFYNYFESLRKQEFDFTKKLPSCAYTYDVIKDCTPIGRAVFFNCPALVGALIKAGADVNCGSKGHKGRKKHSPLHFTVYPGLLKIWRAGGPDTQKLTNQCIEILTKNGCDPNIIDHVVRCDAAETLKSLVKAKADINLMYSGSTCLHSAIFYNDISMLEMVETIVELGVDLFAVNSKKQAAVDLARKFKDIKVAEFLERAIDKFIMTAKVNLLKLNIPNVLVDIICGYLNSPVMELNNRITVLEDNEEEQKYSSSVNETESSKNEEEEYDV